MWTFWRLWVRMKSLIVIGHGYFSDLRNILQVLVSNRNEFIVVEGLRPITLE